MSDYYSRFKGATPELIKAKADRKELTRSLKRAQGRLVDEQVKKAKVLKRVEKLKEKTAENYHDSAVEDFKRKLDHLDRELSGHDNTIEMLEAAIKSKGDSLNVATTNIRLLLKSFYMANLGVPNAEIQTILGTAEAVREGYQNDFKRIYQDFAEELFISDESMLPGPWGPRETISELMVGLKVQCEEPEPLPMPHLEDKAATVTKPGILTGIIDKIIPSSKEPETFEDAGGGMAVKGSKAFEDNQNIGQ